MTATAAAAALPATRNPVADLLAGLSISGLLLLEAIAYAGIAEVPPQAGVIGLLAGLLCYALIGRSRYAIVMATSSSSAVLAAGTLALASLDGASRAAVAATMVVITGVLFLLAAGLRLGGLSQFVARPVLRGFAFGLAWVIAIGQVPHLAGLPAVHGDFVPRLVWQLARSAHAVQPWSLGCGLAALALLFASERLRRVPGGLLVIALGIAVSPWLVAHGVSVTGRIELTPTWAWPGLPTRDQWLPSIELGAALVLVLYAESYGSIRTFALRHGDAVDANRDLFALGIANTVSGLLHGVPVGAGYSVTAANEAAGARSRLAGLSSAICVLLMLALLLGWIERLPSPVLAAIVIHAVSKSWRLSAFAPYLRWHRDRLLALAAVVAVLAMGILHGLLLAIGLSLVLLLRQLATPRLSVLGRLDGGHDFVDVSHPDTLQPPGVLVLRPEVPLFFANAEAIFALARTRTSERTGLRAVVLSLEESPDLDSTTLEALAEFAAWLDGRGIALRLARLKDGVRDALQRAEIEQLPPVALGHYSVDDAVTASMP